MPLGFAALAVAGTALAIPVGVLSSLMAVEAAGTTSTISGRGIVSFPALKRVLELAGRDGSGITLRAIWPASVLNQFTTLKT